MMMMMMMCLSTPLPKEFHPEVLPRFCRRPMAPSLRTEPSFESLFRRPWQVVTDMATRTEDGIAQTGAQNATNSARRM